MTGGGIVCYLMIGVVAWLVSLKIVKLTFEHVVTEYGDDAAKELEKMVAKTQWVPKHGCLALWATLFMLLIWATWPIAIVATMVYYYLAVRRISLKYYRAK